MFSFLDYYDVEPVLIKSYIEFRNSLTKQKEGLSGIVFQKKSLTPEILVWDIVSKLKPFIMNAQ